MEVFVSRSSFLVILLVLFLAGVFIIFNSVSWGSAAANVYLRSQGGDMDAAQFAIILQEYINAYRWLGGILSFVSGLGMVRIIELRN
jgi:hypothetical protein